MPPKKNKKNQPRRSQNPSNTVIAIEEHFRRSGQGDSPEDVARKLNQAYQEEPSSLNNSLVCFVLRACGLAAEVAKVDFQNISGSLNSILELANDKKVSFQNERTPLISKDKANERYIQKIREFVSILLQDDYQPMRAHKDNKMLACLHQCIAILSKSTIRYLRLTSNTLACIIVEAMAKHFVTLIDRKQSRKAFELVKQVEFYLPLFKERIRDRDSRVREVIHVTLKHALLGMETDLFNEKTIQEFFLSLIRYNNPKISEQTLEILLSVVNKSNKLKKAMVTFAKNNSLQLWRAAIISNKSGILTIRFLIELYKSDPSSDLLNPEHISRLFEAFEIEKYTFGIQTVIEAFYVSIYPSNEELIKNRNSVTIQIMNLVSNFNAVYTRQAILQQFCEYGKVPIEDILSVPDLFAMLIEQAYTQNGEQIEFKERDMVSWLVIIEAFINYVHKNLEKLENASSEKLQKERQKWLEIGQAYNMHLLSNIKTIIHEKMRGELIPYFLRLMSKLVLPVGSAFEGYLDFMYERIVGIFERETEIEIFKEIVKIFSRTNTHNIGLLVKGLTGESQGRNRKEKTIIILKKISILHQYFIEQFLTLSEIQQLISTFKTTESQLIKVDLIFGLFAMHQWWINSLVESDLYMQKMMSYQRIKEAILGFYFDVLESRESVLIKMKAVACLLRIMEFICADSFKECPQIYYSIKENQIGIIYRFLNCEIGLPLPDEQDDESRDFARMMGHLSFQDADRETVLLQLFAIFQSSLKVACFPVSIRFIVGALLAEEQKHENADLSTTRVNVSLSVDRMPFPSLYARQKPASKYLAKLFQQQLAPENRNTFIFWQIVQETFRELKQRELKVKQVFLNRVMDIYFKRKMTPETYYNSLNKALLFVMAELDRITPQRSYDSYHLIRVMMGKLTKRKIKKQSIRRVYMFIKERPEPQEFKDAYKGLLTFLDKASKAPEMKQEQENSGSDGEGEEGEVNEREMMRPIENRRETRSRSKREANYEE